MNTQNSISGVTLETGLQKRWRLRVVAPAFPAFNIYSRIARITTALGPVCIATVANKSPGWDAEVVDENNYRRFGPSLPDGRPDHAALQALRHADVVGLYGGLTSTAPRLYELARLYSDLGVLVIAGGQHFVGDNVREALANGIRYVVCGEGEATVHELLQALRSGRQPDDVAGLAFLRNGEVVQTPPRPPLTDFDLLPTPDFSLVRHAKLRLYPVAWVRGCGMQCEFCTVKGRVRCPAPEYVLAQITGLVEQHGARHFFVVDDLFGQQRDATLRLCEQLRDYQEHARTRLDLTVQIRLDKARDAELLKAMRLAGINTVAIGFESPISEELNAMHKRLDAEEMVSLSRRFHDAGFLVHGMFIFGYPVMTGTGCDLPIDARILRFRTFIRQARIDTVQILLPVPLPGTEMTERLAAQNRVFPRDCVGWEYYDGNFPLFEPDPPLTAEQMQTAARRIMGRFYRFKHMWLLGLDILLFPSLILSLHNIKRGWRTWYRSWRNNLIRFGGWVILRRWTTAFRKGGFDEKLLRAHEALAGAAHTGHPAR